MHLWIDNAGLHSAASCLEGKARPENDYDVRGLLQLATLLIYGDKISINQYEPPAVSYRTCKIVETLRHIGIGSDILHIRPISEADYANVCKTAADCIAPDLCDSFNPNELAVLGKAPMDLPRTARLGNADLSGVKDTTG